MTEVKVLLDHIDKVQAFNCKVRNSAFEMDLGHGRYTVDAKSIMGIFSLDLSKPFTLKVYDSEDDKFDLNIIKEYIVE